ncbi:hypothetical protein [Dankookia sp. P2]|uniref:hypothetical protein n=1 Tax=Dankookia sp. P2 TaxID=3423955 RepID=UPI003D67D6DC
MTRAVAAEGLAGRAAARAAAEAEKATRDACTFTHYHLLLELVRQGDPDGQASPLRPGDLAALEQRARAVLVARRTDGSLSPASAFEALAELAEVVEPCGLPGDPTRARLPQLAGEIAGVIQDLGRWADLAGPAERSCIRLLSDGAMLTHRCFRVALKELHDQLGDLWTMVQRWRLAPEAVSALAARPEWLLDGWELICGLWRAAGESQRARRLARHGVAGADDPGRGRRLDGLRRRGGDGGASLRPPAMAAHGAGKPGLDERPDDGPDRPQRKPAGALRMTGRAA